MEPRLQRRIQRYGWDKASEFYDDCWKQQLKPAQDKLLEMVALQPGEKVIETSCGTGLVTLRAAKQVESAGSVTATDISGRMVEIAAEIADRRQVTNVSFLRMDAEELELTDKGFDAAICSLGLMYFPYPVEALKEMHRVLKTGGRAAVAIWGERNNCGWADIFPIVDNQVASEVCPMFFQQGTGKTLHHSFREAGFRDLKIERIIVSLPFSSEDQAVMAAFFRRACCPGL